MSNGTNFQKEKKNKNRLLAKQRGFFPSIQRSYKKVVVKEEKQQTLL